MGTDHIRLASFRLASGYHIRLASFWLASGYHIRLASFLFSHFVLLSTIRELLVFENWLKL